MVVPRTTPPLSPEASVCALIPHHGCEAWLAQAIESLLDQTRPPERIVVIDDASPVPPVDIVAAFPEVTLVGVDVNGGPYRLVQAVIDATDFDAYLFQDADDWSAPDRLEVLLATGAETGAGLVGSHEVRVLVDAGDVVGVSYPLDVNAALRAAPAAYPLLHPTSVIARRLLDRLGGFATGMRFSGDAELLRRAAHLARVVNADHHGYFRRKRRGSLSHGSDTALGTPARRAVHDALAARARDNAARAARGLPPDLTPWRRAPSPALRHLLGPTLDARPVRAGQRLRRPAPSRPAPAPAGPVFVVGAPRSGAGPLAWALGQHPELVHLHDSRWLARTCADLEVRAREEAARPPTRFRAALAGALTALAGAPGRRTVAAGTELAAAGSALVALFPDARFLHVTRSPDSTVAALAATPTEGGAYLGAASAWQAWLDAARDGLALEAALGSGRVLRVDHAELLGAPASVAARCLAFLGLHPDRACATALAELGDEAPALLRPAAPDRGPDTGLGEAPAHVVAAARDLWAELAEPRPATDGSAEGRARLTEQFDRRQRAGRPAGGSLVERVRALVCEATPAGATVAVISRGDARLVGLPDRTGWHLPQVHGGTYAGHHPADSAEALGQLHDLHRRGAQYLAVPATDLWWLAHYDGLRDALARDATLVAYHHDVGAVYRLAPAPADALRPGFVAVPGGRPAAAAGGTVVR